MRKYLILSVFFLVLSLIIAPVYAQESAAVKEEPAKEEAQKLAPKKIDVDSNYDGKIDRIEAYDVNGKIERVEIDSNFDGAMDETMSYKDGKPQRSERDSNNDGKADIWIEY